MELPTCLAQVASSSQPHAELGPGCWENSRVLPGRSENRSSYICRGAQCTVKMWAPCLNVRDFRMESTEAPSKRGPF